MAVLESQTGGWAQEAYYKKVVPVDLCRLGTEWVYQDFGIHGFREMRAKLGTGAVHEEKGIK